MTDDNWKTIRVPKDAWKTAKAQKEERDRTWGEQLTCGNVTTTEVVEVDEVVEQLSQQNGESEVDATTLTNDIVETIVEELDLTQEVTVDRVTVEQNDDSGVTADDVESIVEGWIEQNADRLRRGEI